MKWIMVFSLLVSGSAFGGSGGLYYGYNLDKYLFTVSFGIGIGGKEEFYASMVHVEITKNHRTVNTIDSCIYFHNPDYPERNHIECNQTPKNLLSGVVYERIKSNKKLDDYDGDMICTKGCTKKIPKILKFTYEEDNC